MLCLLRRNLGVTLFKHHSLVSPLSAVGDGVLMRDTEKRPLIVGVCTPGFPTLFLEVLFPLPGEGEGLLKCNEPAPGVSALGDGDLDLAVFFPGVSALGDGDLDLAVFFPGVSALGDGDLDLAVFFPINSVIGDFLGDGVFVFAGL